MAELTETTVERSRWTSKSSSKTKASKGWSQFVDPFDEHEQNHGI